jgi:hypothetical protein
MIIIGVDYHPSGQYIALVDTETGEYGPPAFSHNRKGLQLVLFLSRLAQMVTAVDLQYFAAKFMSNIRSTTRFGNPTLSIRTKPSRLICESKFPVWLPN